MGTHKSLTYSGTQGGSSIYMIGAWSDLPDDLGESPGKAGGDCSSPGDIDTGGRHF